jgi:peptidoglycan/xylan/chitin deacetylase (PgdA/CDA1 family)
MRCRQEGALLPPKPIVVTFDDGFMSNYQYGFPVLRALDMKATIFVTPDPDSANFRKYGRFDRPLTAAQMREMSAAGISIQSHGMTHRYLTGLDDNTLRWELSESRRVLERTVGAPVRFLAVPSGAYDRTVRRAAAACGYEAVFCMLKGTNGLRANPFTLRRLVIARDDTSEDLRRLLRPSSCALLRILGFWQSAAAATLGMKRLDALRRRLYGARVVRGLSAGRIRALFGTLVIVAALAVLTAAILIVAS